MNKEEIEEAKKHYIFSTKHELDINNKRLKEYIEYLEYKLYKLTDKLKEDIDNSIKGMNTNIVLIKEYYKNKKEYAQEILSIIESEKK